MMDIHHVIPAKAGTSGGSAVSRLFEVTACLHEVPAFAGMTRCKLVMHRASLTR